MAGLTAGGLLRGRVSLLSASRVRNGSGGWTETFGNVVAVLAGEASIGDTTRHERIVGEQPAGVELIDLTLNDPLNLLRSEHRARLSDGREYELVQVQRQGSFVIAVGRRV